MNAYHAAQVRTHRGTVVGRRDFLRSVSLAGLAAGATSWHDAVSLQAAELRRAGKACILLWLQGAPSQFETFDPKPGHANGGETKAIATNVAGVRISENLPETAKVMDRIALIRSLSTKEGNHQRASYMLHTSYVPTATVRHPTFGAVVAHELPNATSELPSFVRVGGRGQADGNGGYLGAAFDPFSVQSAARLPSNTQPTTSKDRYLRRLDLIGKLESAAGDSALAQTSADHRKLYADASKMILSTQMEAFDISRESEQAKSAYGEGEFASGCLLARRLVESGVPFVEVQLGNWDTHDDNFNRCRTLCEQMDRPYAALLRDLETRGLLDRTLVVLMGEFGRTPRINPRGGRDHYPRAFFSALAGCGVRAGQVVGSTDKGGEEVVDAPMNEKDLFRSMYRALGIDADKEQMTPIGRPLKFVEGGTAVDKLFA